MRNALFASVVAAVLGVAATADAQDEPRRPTQTQEQKQQAPSAAFSDTQLRAYVAAKAELDRLAAQGQPQDAQVAAILARHQLDRDTYARVASAAQRDQALERRIASLQRGAPHQY